MAKRLRVKVAGRWFTVQVGDLSGSPLQVLVDGQPVDVDIELLGRTSALPQQAVLGQAEGTEDTDEPAAPDQQAPSRPSQARVFRSPMPGVVLSVAVEKGQQVVTGDEICVLEAMKMQQSLRADWSGIISTVHVKPGEQVLDGDPLVELGEGPDPESLTPSP